MNCCASGVSRCGLTGNSEVVLDSSAVLALLFGEPGGEKVQELLPRAAISAVNVCEVLSRLARAGVPREAAETSLACLDLPVAEFRAEEAAAAAAMVFRGGAEAGLSLGDRACLATAGILGLPAITADRQWASLTSAVEIRLIR